LKPRHAADAASEVEPRAAWVDEEWDGYCPVCDGRVTFHAYGPWYRDQLVCTSCGSIPRQRALMLVLSIVRPDWRQARLWDIAPSGPTSARLERECETYLASHYRAGVPPGMIVDGTRNEDLERPSFPDGSMDVIVSSDVFEHVIDIDLALTQIARVLTSDGLHVWTVPQISTLVTSKPRVRRGPSGLEYLEPVEVHGDPVCADGAIVTFDWGQDLPERVETASGMSTVVFRVESRQLGLLGEYREVFVSQHGPGNPIEELRRRGELAAMEPDGLRAALSASERTIATLLASKSWRVTGPLRRVARAIRR
jgi:hypothetical protein